MYLNKEIEMLQYFVIFYFSTVFFFSGFPFSLAMANYFYRYIPPYCEEINSESLLRLTLISLALAVCMLINFFGGLAFTLFFSIVQITPDINLKDKDLEMVFQFSFLLGIAFSFFWLRHNLIKPRK